MTKIKLALDVPSLACKQARSDAQNNLEQNSVDITNEVLKESEL